MKRSIGFKPVSRKKLGFHIEPIPARPEVDRKVYLDEAWKMLQPAISIIFQDAYTTTGAIDCNLVLRAVERACRTHSTDILFHLIEDECEPHISAAIQSLQSQISDPDLVFLRLVHKCWLDFKRKMMFMTDLANGISLLGMGKELFQKYLSLSFPIQDKLSAAIPRFITDHRLGKPDVDMTLLKNLVDMLRGSSYAFEKPFLDSACDFYAAKAEQLLQQSDISQYLKYVERSLCEEEKICNFLVINRISTKKVVETQLLEVQSSLLEKGFTVLMDEGRMRDLGRMYLLFYGADLMGYMDRFLRSYIGEKGAISEGGSLLELHTCIRDMFRGCFMEDALFGKRIRKCFEGLGLHFPLDEYSVEWYWDED